MRSDCGPKAESTTTSLLPQKKHLVFYGKTLVEAGVFVAFILGTFAPLPAEAGVLSSFLKFLGKSEEIEETVTPFIPRSRASGPSALEADPRPPQGENVPLSDENPSMIEDNALAAPLNPLGNGVAAEPAGGLIFVYTIRPGDTVASIAEAFDVSTNTILWANGLSNPRGLRVGDQIVILPVTGVQHTVQKGDTIAGIAKKYRADVADILESNGFAEDGNIAVGSVILVPDGELAAPVPISPRPSAPSRSFANLPVHQGYYLRPISGGQKSRGIHGYNGVDLANSCGVPVVAAATGRVIIARAGGWNGGYGRYVVISHPNNTQTLYAHLKELSVDVGTTVSQGDVIGSIGSSGNSTGCHVHFEVRGARNPF